jgi:membrane protein YqaA with SNARE-associated domain
LNLGGERRSELADEAAAEEEEDEDEALTNVLSCLSAAIFFSSPSDASAVRVLSAGVHVLLLLVVVAIGCCGCGCWCWELRSHISPA